MTDKTATEPTGVPEATQKLGEQMISAVKQSQNVALDSARAFAAACSSLPVKASDIPGMGALPDVSEVTAYGFDLATEMLALQKDFAMTLAATLVPSKTS